MTADDPRHRMLAQMSECAFRLGERFGAAAEQAETHAERLAAYELFDRCFFAVRVSIALELRLQREARLEGRLPVAAAVAQTEAADNESGDREPGDDEPAEIERYTELDRDRDREPASLPVLLSTLTRIADVAAGLPGPPPAELPTLRELLARVSVQSASADVPAGAATAPGGATLRTRLAGSATTPLFAMGAPAAPWPPPRRRATGPPA